MGENVTLYSNAFHMESHSTHKSMELFTYKINTNQTKFTFLKSCFVQFCELLNSSVTCTCLMMSFSIQHLKAPYYPHSRFRFSVKPLFWPEQGAFILPNLISTSTLCNSNITRFCTWGNKSGPWLAWYHVVSK